MTTWASDLRLGPYQLVAPIGAGGMGEVWKAHDTRLDRFVAIKRLLSPSNPRFEIEARAIAALNHPHICQIHDVGPDYLVLEYVNGRPLRGPLAADAAVRLARQVADALEAAHAKGILHRDLKPSNVLVTEDGTVKLLDFGVAKLTSTDPDTTRTEDGTVVGTAAYMSPEQAQGQPIDVRSEVFSFGAVLYELLAGRRAFEGASTAAVLSAVLRDEPPPLAVPTGLDALVRRCLQKDPKRRFPTMGAVQAALDDLGGTRQAGRSPSIAVLSFTNLSADPENEYFGDGLAEEIINLLAQTPGLKVIARTSAFAFKGKQEDIRRIAEILDVMYVLEGSVRKAGNRIRVTAQLISARDSGHVWSKRYDRELADVFAIQDEIAHEIGVALHTAIGGAFAFRQRFQRYAEPACLRGGPQGLPLQIQQGRLCQKPCVSRASDRFGPRVCVCPQRAWRTFSADVYGAGHAGPRCRAAGATTRATGVGDRPRAVGGARHPGLRRGTVRL